MIDGFVVSATVYLADPLTLDGLDPIAGSYAINNALMRFWAGLGMDAPSAYASSGLRDPDGRVVAIRVLFRREA
jgi:hypothetical protein